MNLGPLPHPTHPTPASSEVQKALPEGSVQALTFELEERQVGLGYSPAEVIATGDSGNKNSAGDQAKL